MNIALFLLPNHRFTLLFCPDTSHRTIELNSRYRFKDPVHRHQNMVGKHRIPAGDNQEDPGWLQALQTEQPPVKSLIGGKKHKMAIVANA